MNNYMRRLVDAKKKKNNKEDDKKKTAPTTKIPTPSAEVAAAATTTKPRSFRRRNRLIPHPVAATNKKSNPTQALVGTTRTKLSLRRLSGVDNDADGKSNINNKNVKDEDAPPTKDSWMALAKDSSDSENNDACVSHGDEFKEATMTTEVPVVSEITDGQHCDLHQHPPSLLSKNNSHSNINNNSDKNIGNRFNRSNDNHGTSFTLVTAAVDPSSPTRSVIFQNENLEQELADVQMDRDIMREQLSEARTELVDARTSLRNHISDLEHQLRTFQQSQQRQTELEENLLLEKELDQLAQLTKEQEEKNQFATKQREELNSVKGNCRISNADDIGGDSVDYDAFSISTADGSSAIIVESPLSSPERDSIRFFKERVVKLEDKLKERKFREQILEKEVRQLKNQAEMESQKFKETQRQVQWFQQELQALASQEDSEGMFTFSQGIVRGRYSNNDNDNPGDLGLVFEGSIDEGASNDDYVNDNDDIVGRSVTADLPPPHSPSNSKDDSNHVALLHQQRKELENRVKALLDEVGTLRQYQGAFEQERQQHRITLRQLQTDIQQEKANNQLGSLLMERQLKEWQDRSASFQHELQEECRLSEQQNANTRLERHEWHGRVEKLEICSNELKK